MYSISPSTRLVRGAVWGYICKSSCNPKNDNIVPIFFFPPAQPHHEYFLPTHASPSPFRKPPHTLTMNTLLLSINDNTWVPLKITERGSCMVRRHFYYGASFPLPAPFRAGNRQRWGGKPEPHYMDGWGVQSSPSIHPFTVHSSFPANAWISGLLHNCFVYSWPRDFSASCFGLAGVCLPTFFPCLLNWHFFKWHKSHHKQPAKPHKHDRAVKPDK